MPVLVEERFESRDRTAGDSPATDLRFWISGTDDDSTALAALLSTAPLTYCTLVFQSANLSPIGPDLWDGTVRYGPYTPEDPKQPGDSSYQFDTGGGTHKITQSLQTMQRKAPAGKTAPDFKGAIGVTQDDVEGVDVTIPVYNFSETHIILASAVTNAYKSKLFALTGKTNNGQFRGFAVGEVLFLGASGAKRGKEDWEISFKFAASPNVQNLAVGEIQGIDKKGWDYLWIRYADSEDAESKTLVKKPLAAYVERVYDSGDFGDLGIGE